MRAFLTISLSLAAMALLVVPALANGIGPPPPTTRNDARSKRIDEILVRLDARSIPIRIVYHNAEHGCIIVPESKAEAAKDAGIIELVDSTIFTYASIRNGILGIALALCSIVAGVGLVRRSRSKTYLAMTGVMTVAAFAVSAILFYCTPPPAFRIDAKSVDGDGPVQVMIPIAIKPEWETRDTIDHWHADRYELWNHRARIKKGTDQ